MEQNTPNTQPQPQAPQPEPVESSTGSTPPRKTKNPALVIAAVVGGLAVIGIIGWFIYSSAFAIKSEDYLEGAENVNSVITAGSGSTSSLLRVSRISSTGTETTTNNNLESAEEGLEKFKQAHAELDGMKVLRDSDVREAYDDYSETYNKYVSFAETYIGSAKKVLPAVVGCEADSRGFSLSSREGAVEEFREALQPCLDTLADIGEVKDADLKEFIDTYNASLNRMMEIVEEAVKLDSSDFRAMSELRSELNDIMRDLSNAQRDANSNIQKRLDDVHPREDISDLAKVIREKAREQR